MFCSVFAESLLVRLGVHAQKHPNCARTVLCMQQDIVGGLPSHLKRGGTIGYYVKALKQLAMWKLLAKHDLPLA